VQTKSALNFQLHLAQIQLIWSFITASESSEMKQFQVTTAT
jgi:hypothetical protein